MRNLCLLILFLGLSFETLQVHALNKRAVRAKSLNVVIDKRKMRWKFLTDSVDATRGAEHLQWAKKLYQVALEKKDEYHKEEALREIMAYYVTLKNYSELYQPNNGRRTHRCLLLLKSGEECSFGFDSRNRKYICRRCSLCRYQ